MKYLTHAQYKLDKSVARGYKTVGLNLSPATEAQQVLNDKTIPTMCQFSGTCANVCLVKTGMNVFPAGQKARAQRTRDWVKEPAKFLQAVTAEVVLAEQAARKGGMKFAVRPNLLSDQPRLAQSLAKALPHVQFYDYTKLPRPRGRMLDNYHLTYSVSEKTTAADLRHCLTYGVNMAVVVNLRKGAQLPKKFRVQGQLLPVIDGDKDDLRFLDNENSVVMLRWKGSKQRMAEGIKGGFVIDVAKELVR